ncbi:hypothetical protein [Streptomyces sp. NPDC006997]|uniref:hypothetical protein n=1 Tax=Streptomyces sp. NPDC006997 TaxID=3155356 RepID=UPI0033E0CD43
MKQTSRRGVLAALAASAVTVPLATVPARAAQAAAPAVEPLPVPAGTATATSSVTMPALNAAYFSRETLAERLTATVLPGTPARTEVTSGGRQVATLTHGARTQGLGKVS